MTQPIATVLDVEARALRLDDIILQDGMQPLLVVDVMTVPEAGLTSVACRAEDQLTGERVPIHRIWPSTQVLHVGRWEIA